MLHPLALLSRLTSEEPILGADLSNGLIISFTARQPSGYDSARTLLFATRRIRDPANVPHFVPYHIILGYSG